MVLYLAYLALKSLADEAQYLTPSVTHIAFWASSIVGQQPEATEAFIAAPSPHA